MVREAAHKKETLDGRQLHVQFSPAVQDAFRAIAVTGQRSSHFDPAICDIAKQWSSGKLTTAHDVMIGFAPVAREVAAHIHATGDETMKEAWDDLCASLPENGFAFTKVRQAQR